MVSKKIPFTQREMRAEMSKGESGSKSGNGDVSVDTHDSVTVCSAARAHTLSVR